MYSTTTRFSNILEVGQQAHQRVVALDNWRTPSIVRAICGWEYLVASHQSVQIEMLVHDTDMEYAVLDVDTVAYHFANADWILLTEMF